MSRKQRTSARRQTGAPGSPPAPRPTAPVGRGTPGARRASTAQPPRSQTRTWLLLGGAAVIVVASIVAVVLAQGARQPTGPAAFRSASPSRAVAAAGTASLRPAVTVDPAATGFPTLDGVACDPSEQVTYHVHAHLNIRIQGQLETIPADVGQRSTCLYWLHTHQPLGVIHIEAPAPVDFTLGQFFDVWGKPLDATTVGDWAVPAGSRIWVFVDRKPVEADPRSIKLTDLGAIELQVGPAALEPLPYTFPADFG